MDKKGMIIGIVAILVVLGIVFFVITTLNKGQQPGNQEEETKNDMIINAGAQTHTVEITESGFSPRVLNIKRGDTVTWINKGDSPAWPASAMHPTHTFYPGVDYDSPGTFSGSKGCIAEGQPKPGAFDACKSLGKGESWSFTFTQKGSWNYHNHLQTFFGTINVE